MAEPLFVSQEIWGSTYPTWDGLVAYKHAVDSRGFRVREWRMHPRAFRDMLPDVPTLPGVLTRDYARLLLGAPLVIDSTLEESRARVLIHAEAITLPEPVPAP